VNKSIYRLASQAGTPVNRTQAIAQAYSLASDKLSIRQVALLYGISPYTVRRYLKKAARQQQKGGETR